MLPNGFLEESSILDQDVYVEWYRGYFSSNEDDGRSRNGEVSLWPPTLRQITAKRRSMSSTEKARHSPKNGAAFDGRNCRLAAILDARAMGLRTASIELMKPKGDWAVCRVCSESSEQESYRTRDPWCKNADESESAIYRRHPILIGSLSRGSLRILLSNHSRYSARGFVVYASQTVQRQRRTNDA